VAGLPWWMTHEASKTCDWTSENVAAGVGVGIGVGSGAVGESLQPTVINAAAATMKRFLMNAHSPWPALSFTKSADSLAQSSVRCTRDATSGELGWWARSYLLSRETERRRPATQQRQGICGGVSITFHVNVYASRKASPSEPGGSINGIPFWGDRGHP